MKKILNLIILASCIATLGSCEDDKDPVTVANGFELRSSEIPAALTLLPANDAEKVVTLTWDRSDNGGGNTVSTYTIEIAPAGTNFATPLILNGGASVVPAFTYDLKVAELNKLANLMPTYACGQEMTVDIRVKSVLGNGFYNAFTQYSSNVITLKFAPYSNALPAMMFASAAPVAGATANLAASSPIGTDFEGYMWLEPGMYKFYKASTCGTFESPVVYGDNNDGTFNVLVQDGQGYQVTTAGFYLVTADSSLLKYSVRAISWNFFGTAKPLFPGANTALAYDAASGLWKTTFTLYNGYDIQFRSNGTGAAALLLGAYDATKTGTKFAGPDMSYDGGFITVPGTKTNPRTSVSYNITLDLRSPRNYKYSIVAANP